jgi:hypothetical protein
MVEDYVGKRTFFSLERVTLFIGKDSVVCFTALSPGDDVYSCSVVPACDGIVQNGRSSVLLLPVHQSYLHSPAAVSHVSV